ncbi:uncharacterized protein LOC109606517 isoform X2 [Aethina tumida]|uniref:uncharacterized protein LOC109606517 isoform X2 n=1 Tax=Aethina tumida TaxID=116153 RepID=UPI00096B4C11|nr:uncharacterized protein LOC109606517 isoform X2 [Aethina tumida]
MPSDCVYMAKIRNNAEKCMCTKIISRIEKEKRTEMNVLNHNKNQFLSKFSKKSSKNSVASVGGDKLYTCQIHPGSCDKCNISNNYKILRDLLFTEDEIDIEKMLCLHLLSNHDTCELTPPRVVRKIKMTIENSPLERLIYRSKRTSKTNEDLIHLLKSYILECPSFKENKLLISDRRLDRKYLYNEKVAELLNTSLKALEISNKPKLREIFRMATEEETLIDLMQCPKIENYIQKLSTLPIFTSCESYVLKSAWRIKPDTLRIVTRPKILESFLSDIHKTVLQLPSRRSFCESESDNFNYIKTTNSKIINSPVTRKPKINIIKGGATSRKLSRNNSSLEFPLSKSSLTSLDRLIEEIANAPPNLEKKQDERSLEKRLSENVCPKITLRQINCEACTMRWLNPLPTPKIPNVRSNSHVMKTNSACRLSCMINDELYSLRMFGNRYSEENGKYVRFKKPKEGAENLNVIPEMAISSLDLDRIKHEIRDKETKKKLRSFLSEPICDIR